MRLITTLCLVLASLGVLLGLAAVWTIETVEIAGKLGISGVIFVAAAAALFALHEEGYLK